MREQAGIWMPIEGSSFHVGCLSRWESSSFSHIITETHVKALIRVLKPEIDTGLETLNENSVSYPEVAGLT
jgi:hypothetical protein